jgi:large subunit ribosomal protein L53
MNLDLETLKIKDIMTEVDRHSRMLGRKEELAG